MCSRSSFIAIFAFVAFTGSSDGDIASTDLVEKGNKLLASASNRSVPFYLHRFGKEGVNFNVDQSGRPYIWCEKFAIHECPSQSEAECTTRVKCFAERQSHHLGCMAVLIHNASLAIDNETLSDTTPTMKDCWSQDASELRECLEEDECVVNTRKTGSKDRSAKFCCCRTHNCNRNLTLRFTDARDTTTPDHPPSSKGHWLSVFILSTTGFNVLIAVLVLASVLSLCGFAFWVLRKRHRRYKFDSKIPPNAISLAAVENGHESTSLLVNGTDNLRDIALLEKISSGRFSEVFKGQLGNNLFAVKVFPVTDLDTWVSEQEVHMLKAVKSHPNIVDFAAAFQNGEKYWLVTVFHQNGSLCDYLKNNVLTPHLGTKFISTMLSGLAYLHEETITGEDSKPSVVHRDFKSKNVLIKSDLTTCITDFGLAMKCENGKMSDGSHGQVGTRRYMAPEVLEGATEFSAFAFQQTDVYAAALVLWEVLSRTRVTEDEDDPVPEYLLPYEKEVGASPSLGQIRELVVIRKFRPEIREAHLQNKVSRTIVKTMREMWDMEPDGRITSGCARDRMVRLHESLLCSRGDSSDSSEEQETDGSDLSS